MPAPVIVVHDETDARELVLAALRAAGHEAAGFRSPIVALDAIETDSGARVLVTRVDFGPGVLNGLALARMLKHKRSGISTVFIGQEEHRQHIDGVGILLPFDPGLLVETVSRLLVTEVTPY